MHGFNDLSFITKSKQNQNKKKNKKKKWKSSMLCRGDKIGHDQQTQHDMKLAGYGLRLNGLVSYSS